MTFQVNRNKKKVAIAILVSDKIDCKPEGVTKDKEGDYRVMNRSIHQKDKTVVIRYTPNT